MNSNTNNSPRNKPSHIKGSQNTRSGKHRRQLVPHPRQRSMVVTVRARVIGMTMTFLTRIHRKPIIVMGRHVHSPDTVEKVIAATEERARKKTSAHCLATGEKFSFENCHIVGIRRA